MPITVQKQPSVQSFISTEREIIKRIRDFSERCKRDFDTFTLPDKGDPENPNYFINHCINHLVNAESEIKKVYGICSDFLSRSSNLTPDEVSFLQQVTEAQLNKIEEANKILTDKIDCEPFLKMKENIRPAEVFIEAKNDAECDDLPF